MVVVDDSSCPSRASSTDTGLEFSRPHSSAAATGLLLRPGSDSASSSPHRRRGSLLRPRLCFLAPSPSPSTVLLPRLLTAVSSSSSLLGHPAASRSSLPSSSGLKLRSRNSSFSCFELRAEGRVNGSSLPWAQRHKCSAFITPLFYPCIFGTT